MQAVILAGGKGERLLPLTLNLPKPMVPVNGKPYLHHQVEYLKKFGITEIVMLVGYLGDKIIDYFGDGEKFGVKIKYSIEKELLGTGGALKNAESLLDKSFMVIYGDSFLPINLTELMDDFKKSDNKGTIVVYDNSEDTTVINNVDLMGNQVIEYNKKPQKRLNYVEAGISLFKKDILNYIPSNKRVSLEEEIFPRLIKENQLLAFVTGQRFYDMGTKERLKVIEDFLRANPI